MNTYYVEHTFPKASKLPVYGCYVQARSRSEALFLSLSQAKADGFRGTPTKSVPTIVKSPEAA